MAAKRIEVMEIRQILQLKQKGVSNRQSAKRIGIHRNSVNQYVRQFTSSGQTYKDLLLLGDKELQDLFPKSGTKEQSKYNELSKNFEEYRCELKKVGCTRLTLWREYQSKTPDGYGYTQFNHHLNMWLDQIKASSKLHHKAGDKLYVDYTGKKLNYINKQTGEVIPVEVFVGILPCSSYTYVEASRSQKSEDFITSMNNCLEYIGGVPQSIVPDNLKSAVTKGSKYAPIINKTFKDFGLHYGSTINPTRTYSPKDKALVEGAVKIVYQRIFYALSKMTFFSLEDLNKEIQKLLIQYNDYLLSHIQVSRKQQFDTIEKSQLSSLPHDRYEIKTYKKAKVQKMGYIFLSKDKNYYSAPYRYIGKKVEVRYDSQTVEIYYNGERIASHPRNYQAGKYVTVDTHLHSHHKFYSDWSPTFFERLARPHGAHVITYVQALIDQRTYPEIAYKQCLGIISMHNKYEKGRLNQACKRALKHPKYGYHIVLNILENKMDLQPMETDQSEDAHITNHENIRGENYYNELLKQLN